MRNCMLAFFSKEWRGTNLVLPFHDKCRWKWSHDTMVIHKYIPLWYSKAHSTQTSLTKKLDPFFSRSHNVKGHLLIGWNDSAPFFPTNIKGVYAVPKSIYKYINNECYFSVIHFVVHEKLLKIVVFVLKNANEPDLECRHYAWPVLT